MNWKVKFAVGALLTWGLASIAWAQPMQITVGKDIRHDTSPPLSHMALEKAVMPLGENKVVPIGIKPNLGRFPDLAEPDGGVQTQPNASDAIQLGPTPAPTISASGLSEQDNIVTVGIPIVPPNPNGDIGLDDAGNRIYIQYINLVWGIFDATTGVLSAGPFAGNTFWSGFGGPCENNNEGDPIVLYDDQAGRWVFSQFVINHGIQCVAISTTSNPQGPYHRYAFLVTPGGANDYPKLGVWDDGAGQSAYTFTLRDFGGAGGPFSVSAGVMERDAMLEGLPAQFVKFSNPCSAADCIEGQLPPHQAGPIPPAGTCPTYWTAVDAAFDDSPFNNDGYRNHTLCVDWSNITNTTYTEGPFVVAGSNFDRFVGDISPVNGGEDLDSLSFFTMYRAQYRWFGTNARVVFNTTVDAGGDRAGIRWAETRSADGQSGWFLQQDGTYAPDDGIERWMGSIAQDQDGNIALGYSATGANLFPSVRYTSRQGGDPAGTLPGGEVSCHEGTGAQIASANRWGSYSSMSIDPTDDCTFWYTQEYYETTGSFDFNTRICSFSFAGCGATCEPNEAVEESCTDSVDNDCDGDFDCFDSDCRVNEFCVCVPEPEICDDGIDNDCDGLTDCDDTDCSADLVCTGILPPENDDCSDAIELVCPEGGGAATISGTTIDATFDDVGFCGTSNTAPGVWYSVVHDGILTASTCNAADYDTKLSVFDGECGLLGCIAGNDNAPGCGLTSEVTWASDGAENMILVHGFGSAVGDFYLTVSCEQPAEARVVKTTLEGDEAIGQFPFGFDLYAPDLIPGVDSPTETQPLGSGGGTVSFNTELRDQGTWTVVEVLPDGWVSTTDLSCDIAISYPGSEGQTYTCTFDNVENSRVDLLKLTDGAPTTAQTWNFAIYAGPNGFEGTLIVNDSTPPALLNFGFADLDPFATYTLCELEVPAGYSTFWQVDTDGDGIADTTVVPYNPNADDDSPQDLGNRCFDFGDGTPSQLVPGTTLQFEVDNQQPGGNPRTPGYWKNWNACSGGNQQNTAASNGGWEEGFWLLEDVLDPNISGGIVWDDLLADDFEFALVTCEDAVLLLDKRNFRGRKKASDPLHNLAAHLLAAQLNFGAGACTTQEVLDAALNAEELLDEYNFDGDGHDNLKKKDPDVQLAHELAQYLDEYNNGEYCGDFVD